MNFTLIFSLLVIFFYDAVPTLSNEQVQPGVYIAPAFPVNISKDPSSWAHSTPLLAGTRTLLTRTHRNQLEARAPSESSFWRGGQTSNTSLLCVIRFSFHRARVNTDSGDSYTSTGFDTTGTQPSLTNPLGNPTYPGKTSSDGPNYIDFLTTTYNQSVVQTYNFGFGGALIDNTIVQSPFGAIPSLVDQVKSEFQAKYVGAPLFPWASNNALFTLFFGINDAIYTYSRPNNDSLQYAQIKSYENILNQLYQDGARNFVILNIPPVDRTPMASVAGAFLIESQANWIGRFLFRLNQLVINFVRRHPDATAFQFDTNYLFSLVLDNPSRFPETAGYHNTTKYCPAYQHGTTSMTAFDPTCGIPVNEYFWLNDLHPTYPMHNFMASQLSKLLTSPIS